MSDTATKIKAAESITNKGVGFSVIYKGNEIHFEIKKLFLETLIRISGERAKLINFSQNTKSVEVIHSMGVNAPILARCVAIAVINSQSVRKEKNFLSRFRKNRITDTVLQDEDQLTEIFRKTLTSEELSKLTNVIVAQMDSDYFFAATISIGGIDLLAPMNEMVSGPLTPSGEE